MKKYLFIPFLLTFGCDSTAPSQGSFRLDPPVFTGDPVPCEFSLEWENAGTEYELYRSTGAGIETDPSEAVLLCTTDETEWRDSDALQWGTEYYYAVRADEHGWSNEVSSQTPTSPYPPPCELFMDKTGFTDCRLEWTEAEGDFSSYALLRSNFFDIEGHYWYADTLFFSSSSDTTSYTDHFASPDRSTYYTVAVSDTLGLCSFSNVIEFIPGGEIPSLISCATAIHGLQARNYYITRDSQRMTASRSYSSYSIGRLLSTEDGRTLDQAYLDPRFILITENDYIIASHLTENGYMLSLYSPDFETELVTRHFPPASCAVELDTGILLGGISTSILVDPQTLETLQTFNFGFSKAVLSAYRERVFLLSGSGVISLDASSLEVAGGISGYFNSLQEGAGGSIFCCNSLRVEVFDPMSLSMIYQYEFPEAALVPAATLLPPECRYAYVPIWENDELAFRVWDIYSGETPGTVRPAYHHLTTVWDVIPAPSGTFLWFLAYRSDGTQYVFKITSE